ncbi:MAG: fibronectin type III domain-containing protein, partial [Coprobacillaceae bacterium]
MKKVITTVLSIVMMLSIFVPTTVYANETNVNLDDYEKNDAYTYMVLAVTGKVVRVSDDNTLQVDVEEHVGNELDIKSLFNIEMNSEGTRVQIIRSDTNKVWKSDGNSLDANGSKQGNIHNGSWEGFEIITDEETQLSKIRNYNGKYITVSGDTLVMGTTDIETAAEFYIITPMYDDITVYIEHVASGKYIKANGINGDALSVTGEAVDNNIGDDLRYSPMFGEYDGIEVANFISKAYPNLAWKSGGKDEVYQNTDIKAGGWESIIVVPNGDGTISFKDSQNKSYITITDTGSMKRGYKEELTDNEKFIIHTVTSPKKVTDIKTSQVNDSNMIVSWGGVKETIYTGYQVIATPPLGSGKAVITTDETNNTSVMLEDLEPGTNYEIVVRTVNGVSKAVDSKPIMQQTKNGPCPTQPTELSAIE